MRKILPAILATTLLLVIGESHQSQAISLNLPNLLPDLKCGDNYDMREGYSATSKAKVPGQDVYETGPADPANPTTPPPSTRAGARFEDVNLATGADTITPTGEQDLSHFIGKCKEGFKIEESTSEEAIIDNCFKIDEATAFTDRKDKGVLLKLLTPDDIVGDNINKWAAYYKNWYLQKSKATLEVDYNPPSALGNASECLTQKPNTEVAIPSWGPMNAWNRIWQRLRPVNFKEYDIYVNEQREKYVTQSATPNVPTTTQEKPTGEVAGVKSDTLSNSGEVKALFEWEPNKSCTSSGGETIKRQDSKMCFLQSSADSLLTRISLTPGLGFLRNFTSKNEYPMTVSIYDKALSGPIETANSDVYQYSDETEKEGIHAYANYNYENVQTVSYDMLKRPLYSELRYAPGLGDAAEFAEGNLEFESGTYFFGMGNKSAQMINDCYATQSPSSNIKENCGEEQTDAFAQGATSPYTEGEEFQEPSVIEESGTKVDEVSYTPIQPKSDCSVCSLNTNRDWKISQKLIDVLNEAGAAFNVPADVLLGILLHEGWHPTGPHILNFTDAQIEQSIKTGDPYCVRNDWCAAGPFQGLTSESMFVGTIKDIGAPGCPKKTIYDTWTQYTGAAGSSTRAKFNSLLGAPAGYSPHPCKLRDAAFFAAAHVKGKLGSKAPVVCANWTQPDIRSAWRTYYGNCDDNYCDGNFDFLNKVCLPAGSSTPENLSDIPTTGTPWMDTAKGEMGQKEIIGATNNPRIIEYFATTSYKANNDDPPNHWCSAFVNWVLKQQRITGTDNAGAYSWKNWGTRLKEFKYGAIAVLSKNGVPKHVAFAVKDDGNTITLLGGNQGTSSGSDSVNYKIYDMSVYTVTYVYPTGFK